MLVLIGALAGLLAACGTADPLVEAQESGQSSDPRGSILFVSNHNVMLWDDGEVSQLTQDEYAEAPTWAPAGERFAYVRMFESYSEIIVADRAGEPLVQVTDNDPMIEPTNTEDYVFLAAWAKDPDWSPAGEQLIFTSDKGGLDSFSRDLYLWYSETWDAPPYALQASYDVGMSQEGPSLSPDGDQVAFTVRIDLGNGNRVTEIWTLDLNNGTWNVLVAPPEGAYDPDWSPTGEDIAYAARTNGVTDIWVAPVGEGAAYQVTTMGDCTAPAWSPDASQLAFICVVDAEFEVWYVDLERGADGRLTPSEPKQLITADNIDATSGLSWSSS
jgi:Tol biopolymer transport system component